MNRQLHCEFDAADFDATVIETSDMRIVQVIGRGLSPSAGWRLELVRSNPGVVPHPESLWLEVREIPPSAAKARALTETAVEAIIEDSRAERVAIRFRWREGFVLPLRERVRASR